LPTPLIKAPGPDISAMPIAGPKKTFPSIKLALKSAFVVDDKVYAISNPKKVAKFIGDKVKITGTITDNSISIAKISK
jgi:S1-C subfamily serine protease